MEIERERERLACVLALTRMNSFILYKPAMHLNYKHTIFGKLVGGGDTLKAMEDVATDESDRPVVRLIAPSRVLFRANP
jgi:cyclophilin family peptidyl-prolyl cis-trans isomerase